MHIMSNQQWISLTADVLFTILPIDSHVAVFLFLIILFACTKCIVYLSIAYFANNVSALATYITFWSDFSNLLQIYRYFSPGMRLFFIMNLLRGINKKWCLSSHNNQTRGD